MQSFSKFKGDKLKGMTSLLCLGLMTCSSLAPLSRAQAGSLFSAQTLERSMLDLYCQFPGQTDCPQVPAARPTSDGQGAQAGQPPANTLTAADTAVWALEIFDQIAMLDTDQFNDVMTHLGADYRQHPEHRAPIELVLSSMAVQHSVDVTGPSDPTADAVRERLREELRNIRQRNPLISVMDDVLLAFTVAYIFEFGRGFIGGGRTLWASGGEGISRLERFKNTAALVVKSDRVAKNFAKRNSLKIFAAGLGVGLAQAAIESFETYKIDPQHLLEPIQGDIVHGAGVRAAADRDELRAMLRETPDQLRSHAQAYRDRINVIDREVTQIQSEMEHLYNVAAQYRPQMDPVAQDLTETRQKLAQLGLKLDGLELGDGLNQGPLF